MFAVIFTLEVLSESFDSEEELEQWLHNTYEKNASELCFKQVSTEWAYNTDVDNAEAQEAVVGRQIFKTRIVCTCTKLEHLF